MYRLQPVSARTHTRFPDATLFRSGAVHATNPATASRTALMNIRNLDWDDDLLAAFGLERRFLPLLAPTCGNYGTISADMIGVAGVPIAADTVDAHAALFAPGCRASGRSAERRVGKECVRKCRSWVSPLH